MESEQTSPLRRKVRLHHLTESYDVCSRTIMRWVKAGLLPKPVYINGKPFWDTDEVRAADARIRGGWQSLGEATGRVVNSVDPDKGRAQ